MDGKTIDVKRRTRIKICGMTSTADARSAVEAGADAIGLVFHPPSPRHLELGAARTIASSVPPFVARVAVMVNPTREAVAAILDAVPIELLQFHGDEPPDFCASFHVPYLKAARIRPGLDLLEYLRPYDRAAGFLLDTYRADKFGGTGASFDWGVIPADLGRPIVLSGGLDPATVGEAIRRVQPWAVDVSSGVERAPGIKDAAKIAAFVRGARDADQ